MRNPTIIRQKLLKKWIRVLKICTSSKKKMNSMERTKAIKLSIDLAMASSKKGTTSWSRAILSSHAKKASNTSMAREKILQKSLVFRSRKWSSNFMAKRLVQKKTQILRKLVPGGESMEENDLIEETLDYIASLKAQIDVMRWLAIANEGSNR